MSILSDDNLLLYASGYSLKTLVYMFSLDAYSSHQLLVTIISLPPRSPYSGAPVLYDFV